MTQRAAPQLRTIAGDYEQAIARRLDAARATLYPLVRYQADILGYMRERLGIRVLLVHQLEILMAVQAGVLGQGRAGEPPPGVAVSSAQKVGKSLLAVCVSLWFYECFEDAKVFLASSTEDQIRDVLWTEMARVLRMARANGTPIDGSMSSSPTGGLKSSDDSRFVKALVGRDVETLAGRSGRMLLVVDEASALEADKAEALHGNMMGGGFVLMISNPTRAEGPFFDAFHTKRHAWIGFTINGEDVANEHERLRAEEPLLGGKYIPGLINLDALRYLRELYPGNDNPFYIVRVLGRFLLNEAARAIQLHQVDAACARWKSAPEHGLLTIGYDPAGVGQRGDQHAWSIVRGLKLVTIHRERGLDEDRALDATYQLLDRYRLPGEIPRVHIDTEGPIGSALYGRLRGEREVRRLHDRTRGFEVSGVKASSKHPHKPTLFLRVRDELIWDVAEWMKTGAIPPDTHLCGELIEYQWKKEANGLLVATPKDVIRERLGRSPDGFDSLALAVRRPSVWVDDTNDAPPPPPRSTERREWHEPSQAAAGADFWGDSVLDPRRSRYDD